MTHFEHRSQRGECVRRSPSAARSARAASRAGSFGVIARARSFGVASVARASSVGLAAVVLAVWAGAGGAGAAQVWAEVSRLRAFVPGVAGRLEAGRTGRARLVVSNLPRPDALTPDARAFVVWASAGRIVRLGALRRTADGRASFEFTHPANLPRYSLIVTAELSPEAARPAGSPVLSTRALEVDPAASAAAARRASARPPEPPDRATTRAPASRGNDAVTAAATTRPRVASSTSGARSGVPAALATEARSRVCVGGGCGADGFNAEVNGALAADAEARRSLLLVGGRGARRARAWARVSSRDGTAYARVRFRRVPPPARFGARRHVLWAVTDAHGPVYVGSLPAARLNRSPAFVRAENVGDRNFRLLVTAEKNYPAARPAGRRVLLTYKGRRRRR